MFVKGMIRALIAEGVGEKVNLHRHRVVTTLTLL